MIPQARPDQDLLKPSTGFVPSLNGLRAISVVIVIVSHFNLEKYVPGGLGVGIFFFISGFLITRLLLAEFYTFGSIDIATFLVRRFLRLYPPLIIMIIGLIAVMHLAEIQYSSDAVVSSMIYFANYFRIFHGDELSYTALSHTWSLAVEEHFYLLYPLILLWALRSRMPLSPLLAFGCCLALALRFLIHFALSHDAGNYIYNATETRMDFLFAGCLATTLSSGVHGRSYLRIIGRKDVIIIGFVLIFSSLLIRNDLFRDTIRYTCQVIGLFIIVPNLIFGPGFSHIKRILNDPLPDFLGRISYDLYLFHIPIFFFVEKLFQHFGWIGLIWSVFMYAIATAVSVVVASGSYRVIETPLRSIRKRLHP